MQGFITDHERALEDLFGDEETSRKGDACLNVMASRIATVFASLRVLNIILTINDYYQGFRIWLFWTTLDFTGISNSTIQGCKVTGRIDNDNYARFNSHEASSWNLELSSKTQTVDWKFPTDWNVWAAHPRQIHRSGLELFSHLMDLSVNLWCSCFVLYMFYMISIIYLFWMSRLPLLYMSGLMMLCAMIYWTWTETNMYTW